MSIPSNIDTGFIAFKSNTPTFICSSYGSISINEDRTLFSFGKNEKGHLGHDTTNKLINLPTQIKSLNAIKMIDCGLSHTACIDYEGNLFTFGNNDKGQLGIGKDKYEIPFTHIPQKIIDIPPIDFISCEANFTVCITNHRNAFSFGCNNFGQLGLDTCNHLSLSPQLINNLNDIDFIQCGVNHVICKTYSNEYYSWGDNEYGKLGQGNNESCNKPQKCPNWPDNIIDIKCGHFHTLLLTSTGFVYSFGKNNYGALGLNDKNSKSINIPTLIKDIPLIKRIECGYYHSMLIDLNDKLWVFGLNFFGQLGLGHRKNRCRPILNESLHDIIDISTKGCHTFIKTINNEKYAFGYNENSQLGIKTSEDNQSTPIQIFKDNEHIWVSNNTRSKQKSARK